MQHVVWTSDAWSFRRCEQGTPEPDTSNIDLLCDVCEAPGHLGASMLKGYADGKVSKGAAAR